MSHTHSDFLLVLAGQPNTGKSTLFSLLTGLHQRVGNYPGVTVEKKSGHYHEGERRIEVVDLPGTYSLSAYSQEERVTRDFILLEQPEVIVVVVDASNLKRHMHLLFQLLELQVPTVVCLNMADMAHRWGLRIEVETLQERLGVPVVPMTASKGKGLAELRAAILSVSDKTQKDNHEPTGWTIDYGEEIEKRLEPLVREIAVKEHLVNDFSARWLAVKLLENDREARRIVQHHTHDDSWRDLLAHADALRTDYETGRTATAAVEMQRRRDELAARFFDECVVRVKPHIRGTDKIDRVACHPVFGVALFVVIMFVVFQLVFLFGETLTWIPLVGYREGPEVAAVVQTEDAQATDNAVPEVPADSVEAVEESGWGCEWVAPVDACDHFFSAWLPRQVNYYLFDNDPEQMEGLFHSFLVQGVIAGVGGVVTFLPLIFFMFLALSALERSGYIARAVVVLDGLLRRFGLHGQSVLPMALAGGIVGGCAVPAIMATRSMKEERERLLTILVIPLMNCGAKLPVYLLLIGAFFSRHQPLVMTGLILFSWGMALLCAWVLGKTLVRGKPSPLLIELPPYHWPGPRAVLYTGLLRSWLFLKKAGTIILAINICLWFLMSFPRMPGADEQTQMERSFAGRIGKTLVPLGRLAGFDWKDNIALVGGFAAKEVIVSSLKTLHSSNMPEAAEATATDGGEDEEVPEWLVKGLAASPGWTPVKALAMMIFVMLYAPCTASCGVIWRETGKFRWVVVALTYTTALAFAWAVLIYQVGSRMFL